MLLAVVVALAAPTPAQRGALVGALRSLQGDVAVQSVSVSKADPSYGMVRWGFKVATSESLFRLSGGRWRLVWAREADRPAHGACAYAPAKVVRELFRVTCPSAAALHARVASGDELARLTVGFRSSKLTRYWRDATGLVRPCVSRVDPSWSAVIAKFPETKGVIWFRKGAVVHETLFGGGTLPPPKIVLSLAACVGYNAAEYSE
jgi:hypothetical protein